MSIVKLLKFEEGERLKPYKCTAGKTTIGYGRNLDDKGISLQEAGTLLNNDVSECVAQVSKALPWSSALDMPRRDVLVAMCFQLGLNGLLSFSNFLRAMRDGDWLKASQELRNSKFHAQTTQRVDRLIFMLVNGEYVEQAK
jgi:lysozyme